LYTVSIETHFSASHRLVGYCGPCESLHGHTWKVRVTIKTEQLDEIGITVDFKTLKAIIQSVVQKLDHHHINDIPPFDTINPTAENLASHLYHAVKEKMPSSVSMSEVTVWESARYAVSYSE
jgi:6-pyruvoyltetrahydropterin/6-carboxytetrahydropterin synthase